MYNLGKKPEVKLYGKWVYCCKEKCDEGFGGRCNRVSREYPENGLCHDPVFIEYDKERESLGVFEMAEAQ